MRTLFLFLLAFSLSFSLMAQSTTKPSKVPSPSQEVGTKKPVMEFETEVVDYGTVEQNANGKREFKFKNIGNAPLIIKRAQGSCGCTVPDWPKEPILPGQSSVVGVKYATNRLGPINKTITIYSNMEGGTKVLRITGNVVKKTNNLLNSSGPKATKSN